MRLINVKTLEFTSYPRADDPEFFYAILSHTWGDEEVSFQDFHHPSRTAKRGFKKILACCEQAKMDGLPLLGRHLLY